MSNVRTKGIVIRRSDYGDNNCILSIFTPERGIIKAVIYGVKRGKNSSKAAAGQFLCYGEYRLYQGRGDAASVDGANVIEAFEPAARSIAKLALCNYMAEAVWCSLGENNPDERLFAIFMNCVYAVSYRGDDIMKIKAVFELKLMCAEGYMPALDGCVVCGGAVRAFDAVKGGAVCSECRSGTSVSLSSGAYKALRYITGCDDRKMLSFSADDALIKEVGALSESYLLAQLDREFPSLKYFKAVKDL